MTGAGRIGIYGGTFAPVHNGHVRAAIRFLEAERLDRLYVVPAGIPPHKEITWRDCAVDRYRMLELAFRDCPEYGKKLFLSDFEIRRPEKSYTVNTLRHYLPESRELMLLCGTDMFLSLDTWYHAEEIFSLAEIVYVRRENNTEITEQIRRKSVIYCSNYGARIRPLDICPCEISSREIRAMLAEGKSPAAYLPAGVCEYIEEKQLYRDSTECKK